MTGAFFHEHGGDFPCYLVITVPLLFFKDGMRELSFQEGLDEKEVQKVAKSMTEITYVPSYILDGVLSEFTDGYEPGKEKQEESVSREERNKRVSEICQSDPDKTEQLIESWIRDPSMASTYAPQEESDHRKQRFGQGILIFEDLINVESKSFRNILQAAENEVVVKAISTASEEMKAKVLNTGGGLEDREVIMDRPETPQAVQELFSREKVVTIHSEEATLEDIFIQITGRGLQA